jgi:hypothetical protein
METSRAVINFVTERLLTPASKNDYGKSSGIGFHATNTFNPDTETNKRLRYIDEPMEQPHRSSFGRF